MPLALRAGVGPQTWPIRSQLLKISWAWLRGWLNTPVKGGWVRDDTKYRLESPCDWASHQGNFSIWHEQLKSWAPTLSRNRPLQSSISLPNRSSSFYTQDPPRAYSALPDTSFMRLSTPLRDRIQSLETTTLSDNELRDLWRDILESFGDGEPGLPVHGRYADIIWDALISLGARDETVMQEVCEYSNRLWERERQERPTFYADVISALAKCRKYSSAISIHHQLIRKLDVDSEDLLKVLEHGCQGQSSMNFFNELCSLMPGKVSYDDAIPLIISKRRLHEAYRLHLLFMERMVYPTHSSQEALQFLYIHAASLSSDAHECFQKQLSKARVNFIDTSVLAGLDYPSGRARHMNEDDFISKCLAIPSLPVDVILKSIAYRGCHLLGPLSLHHLLLRVNTVADLLAQLKTYGISLNKSRYATVIQTAINENDVFVLDEIKLRNEHPSQLMDMQYQKTQLVSNHRLQNDYGLQYNWAVLRTHGFNDAKIYNLLLCDDVACGNWTQATRTLVVLADKNVELAKSTLHKLHHSLDLLYPSYVTDVHHSDAANFGLLLWQSLPRIKKTVQASFWLPLINLLLKLGRLQEVELIATKIASQLSSRTISPDLALSSISPRNQQLWQAFPLPIDEKHAFFTARLQRDVINWSFIHAIANWIKSDPVSLTSILSQTDLYPGPFVFGLALLKGLRDRHEVAVPDNLIQESICFRFRALMSVEYFLTRHERWSLIQYMVHSINEIWDQDLLPQSELALINLVFGPWQESPEWREFIQEIRQDHEEVFSMSEQLSS